MKYIYLDVCCLCRPFDDYTFVRNFIEGESVLSILSFCKNGSLTLIGSDIIELELSKISNRDKLSKVKDLYLLRGARTTANDQIIDRSFELQRMGFKTFDSLHLASAEFFDKNVVLLTTDDFFVKMAARTKVKVPVKNPANWLIEAMENER